MNTTTTTSSVSRQALHWRKLKQLGLCRRCQQPSDGHVHCSHCREIINKLTRDKHGCKPWRPGSSGRPPIRAVSAKAETSKRRKTLLSVAIGAVLVLVVAMAAR